MLFSEKLTVKCPAEILSRFFHFPFQTMETTGVEPATSGLQSQRSPN